MPAIEARAAEDDQPAPRVRRSPALWSGALRPQSRDADPVAAGHIEHEQPRYAAHQPRPRQHARAELRAALVGRLGNVRELGPPAALGVEDPAVGAAKAEVLSADPELRAHKATAHPDPEAVPPEHV